MLQRFVEHIQKTRLFSSDDKILLAVSGGVDSVVMTHLFLQAGYAFAIAHCNFNLRGADADADEILVRHMAEQYHTDIHCISFNTTEYAKQHRLSIEEAARKLRYDFFATTATQNGYRYIATAHHNNDAIETFFINLVRGTGITGLHGIRQKNKNIIRPLLPFSRQEISNYAAQHNLPFHEDYTNNDTTILRNKIRHNLIPLLKEISPQIEQTMTRNMANIASAEQIYNQAIEQKKQLLVHKPEQIELSKDDIGQLNPRTTYLFEMLRQFGFNAHTVTEIANALNNTGKQFHTTTHTLLIDRDKIIIKPLTTAQFTSQFAVEENTLSVSQPLHITFEPAEANTITNLQTNNSTIIVDASKLQFPLVLRKWHTGDRFKPFGMKNTRKVSDFFKDQHLSLFEKNEKWLLCNANGQIIWIVDMRMDDLFRVTNSTSKAMIIRHLPQN